MMWSLASLATNLVFNLKGELWKREAQLETGEQQGQEQEPKEKESNPH